MNKQQHAMDFAVIIDETQHMEEHTYANFSNLDSEQQDKLIEQLHKIVKLIVEVEREFFRTLD